MANIFYLLQFTAIDNMECFPTIIVNAVYFKMKYLWKVNKLAKMDKLFETSK